MKLRNIIITLIIALIPAVVHSTPRVIHAEWQYTARGDTAGFRLYVENVFACETNNPSATSLECTIDAADGETSFTLATFFQDGTESAHSLPYLYVLKSDLKAVITADPTSGERPLPVDFNASSSTGNIISYEWLFGDGDIGSGSNVSHTFSSAGDYNVTLKVTDNDGAIDQETITISVTNPITSNTPPTAIIASTTSVGKAPLQIHFDGSASTDNDGTITNYAWDMGDGGTATGSKLTYTYVSAGTFNATLTVTDDGGLTDSIATAVIVQPQSGNNIPPNAVITASTKSGKNPLTVFLSAANSTDPDGTITAYSWNFGDGNTGSNKSEKHVFNKVGIFSITLIVTDDKGSNSHPVKYIVSVLDPNSLPPSNILHLGAVYDILLKSRADD